MTHVIHVVYFCNISSTFALESGYIRWAHSYARRAIHSMGENEKSTSWENREEKYNKHSMSRTKGKKATNGGV